MVLEVGAAGEGRLDEMVDLVGEVAGDAAVDLRPEVGVAAAGAVLGDGVEALVGAVEIGGGLGADDLEGGAVRYVRYAGHEAIRAIDYLVRDASWRTPPARFTLLRREESPDRFLVELDGVVKQDDIDYRFRLTVEGHADGRLEVRADGEAHSSFLTNRTGFVVLHPIIGVAGKPVTVTHKDGSTEASRFPDLISPDQPILDIRALRHEVAPGLWRGVLMSLPSRWLTTSVDRLRALTLLTPATIR